MMKKKQPEILNRKPNHLKGQTSPYLLQHLHNPVDWYPWGETAFKKAREEDKPILVSIGYSACHWCHVMEKESFENPEVAEVMNRYFICIKVDREERPDVDHLYMTAVQLLTRQGGWPLNCFALPDTRPFWGGTYFPEDQWKSILMQVADLYKTRKKDLVEQAQQLTEGITLSAFIETGDEKAAFNLADAEHVFHNIMNMMDKSEGGTLRAPKFPLPVNHLFLLHYYHHSGNKSALAQVELSLEKMAMGGIYDQIGGGFARYSTDEIWKVPHFEKMLYDNAQLISLYSHAWKISKKPLYRRVVYDTIEFVSRELTSPEGTFYSALDADSEGEEGKFYVWKENEINEVLGDDAQWVKEYYQIGKKGYWEHENNILLREDTNDAFAQKMNWTLEIVNSKIFEASQKLLNARSARIRPGLDDKVLTSWNALMINGLADAYAAFGDLTLLEKAKHAANFFIENAITDDGKLYRSLNGNKPSIDAFLEDYAILIQAFINLYQVSMDLIYIMKAKILNEYVLLNFSSSKTNFFSFSSNNGDKLPAAFYELPDNVIPSSNSIMALNLLYLSEFFEIRDWRDLSFAMLSDINPQLQNHSISYSNWGRLLLQRLYPFKSVVICGPKAQQYLKELQAIFLPGILIAASSSENNEIPLFKNRFQEGKTLFYVCSNGACKLPVSQLNQAISQFI